MRWCIINYFQSSHLGTVSRAAYKLNHFVAYALSAHRSVGCCIAAGLPNSSSIGGLDRDDRWHSGATSNRGNTVASVSQFIVCISPSFVFVVDVFYCCTSFSPVNDEVCGQNKQKITKIAQTLRPPPKTHTVFPKHSEKRLRCGHPSRDAVSVSTDRLWMLWEKAPKMLPYGPKRTVRLAPKA